MSSALAARFFVLTFVLGWGAGILMTVLQEQVEAAFGPIGCTNPVFILNGPAWPDAQPWDMYLFATIMVVGTGRGALR